jgi:hypothetical protein
VAAKHKVKIANNFFTTFPIVDYTIFNALSQECVDLDIKRFGLFSWPFWPFCQQLVEPAELTF